MLAVLCDDLTADREILLGFCARYTAENRLPVTALAYENAGALLQSRLSPYALYQIPQKHSADQKKCF